MKIVKLIMLVFFLWSALFILNDGVNFLEMINDHKAEVSSIVHE